jgi:hypothetical protein
MRKGRRCLAIVALYAAALGASPLAAGTRVLLRTGAVASDGFGLDGVSEPSELVAGRLLFRGTASALVADRGSGPELLVRSGDQLPPPLAGTFGQMGAVAINDAGEIVFGAAVDSPATVGGVFRVGPGAPSSPVLVTPEALGFADPCLNNALQVAYHTGGSVSVLSATTGMITRVVRSRSPLPGGGEVRRVGPAVVNDAGVVAFVALTRGARSEGGVFTWSSLSGLAPIARTDGTSPDGGVYGYFDSRTPVAINAGGDVAFFSAVPTTAVLLFERAQGTTRVVARVGDAVGGGTIRGFYDRFVGVNSSGTVAFVADVDGTRRLVFDSAGTRRVVGLDLGEGVGFALRLTEEGSVAWLEGPRVRRYDTSAPGGVFAPDTSGVASGFVPGDLSLAGGGATVVSVSRRALYALDHDGVRVVAVAGTVPPGLGPVSSIDSYTMLGRSPVLVVQDDAGAAAMVVERRGRFVKLLSTGDALGRGVTVTYPGDALASGHAILSVVSVAGPDPATTSQVLARTAATGAIKVLVRGGAEFAPGRILYGFAGFAFGGGRLFYGALDPASNQVDLFLRARGRITPIAAVGMTIAEGAVLTDVGSAAATRGRVLFKADDMTGDTTRSSLFEWRHGRARRIFTDGVAVAGGVLGATDILGVLGRTPVLVGFVQGPEGSRVGVFLLRRGVPEPLVVEGDALPDGTILTGLDGFRVGRSEVVFSATLTGAAPAAAALVAATPDRRR